MTGDWKDPRGWPKALRMESASVEGDLCHKGWCRACAKAAFLAMLAKRRSEAFNRDEWLREHQTTESGSAPGHDCRERPYYRGGGRPDQGEDW